MTLPTNAELDKTETIVDSPVYSALPEWPTIRALITAVRCEQHAATKRAVLEEVAELAMDTPLPFMAKGEDYKHGYNNALADFSAKMRQLAESK